MRQDGLRFGLLGPTVLHCPGPPDENPRTIRSAKLRTLLAALLLDANRIVPVEALKEALWAGAPPASAHASLHNHVTRLRRLLDDPERLRAEPPGYRLRVEQGELDVHVFERHLATARGAHAARNWERVIAECAAALALWRGTPLTGLPADLGGYALVRRLREARLLLLEWRYDAELALGGGGMDEGSGVHGSDGVTRVARIVPELTALAAEHPLREAYHRQLMLALHRTGRQAEALAVHRDLRTHLVEELGAEPGPAVREAHVEVLRGVLEAETEADGQVRGGADGATRGRADGPSRRGTDGPSRRGAHAPTRGGGDAPTRGGAHAPTRGEGDAPTRGGAHAPTRGEGDAPTRGRGHAPTRGGDDGQARGEARGEALGDARGEVQGQASGQARGEASGEARGEASGEARREAYGQARGQARREAQGEAYGQVRGQASGQVRGEASGQARGEAQGQAYGQASGQVRGQASGDAQGHAHGLAPNGGEPRDARTPASAPDPGIPDPGIPDTATTPPFPGPAQLPPPPAHFTGRDRTLRRLADLLSVPSSDGRPALAVITGMAGVGKSALALHLAHILRERFPDGQLYFNLHGATPGMTPLPAPQALAALLRDLGTEPRRIPEHPDAAAALMRTLLAPTRTLLVLDDAASAAQIRPLLPAGPGCAVLVTSRSPLTALDGAHRFPLAPLSAEDSAALLRALSGRDDADDGDRLDARHPLVDLTGRLPLALRIVAARLAARRALTPDALAGQLTATQGRLHHLEYDDLSVRRSLAVAHDALAASEREADRDAALALRRVGALDLPSYGAPLLARLTGTDERRAETALDRLVDVALLEETTYGRYTPHDLVRDFARELASRTAPPTTAAPRTGAGSPTRTDPPVPTGPTATPRTTALHWYAAVAEQALVAVLEPGLDQDDRRRPTSAQPAAAHAAYVRDVPAFPGPEEAFAWAETQLENIVALAGPASAEGGDADVEAALVSTLLRLLFPCLQRRGRVAEMEVLGRVALRTARRLGDATAEAYALGDLAGLHFLTGRLQDALALNGRALTIWRRLDRLSWIRRCLNNRGLLLESLGRYEESGDALRESLAYSRQLNDPHGEAVTHSHLGNLYEHTDPRAAIEQHRLSLALGDRTGAVIVQHSAHCNIGYAQLTLGEPAAALPHFEESLRVLGGHSDWHGESQTRLGLVRALRLLGRTGRAAGECAELLRRADARADRYTGGLARHQHGLLLREQGRADEARAQWRAALEALAGTDETAVVAEIEGLLGPSG
ncbi:BTAD domain-containing putative transcriptional regulator [Streptomyces sp. NPDC005811]|uniref:BTAD domain-containing putative transcriptional regulator n=1 Tax=Streptomyces sp. NPDC005811 TaxID=3154565 RepID=UPI00340210A6